MVWSRIGNLFEIGGQPKVFGAQFVQDGHGMFALENVYQPGSFIGRSLIFRHEAFFVCFYIEQQWLEAAFFVATQTLAGLPSHLFHQPHANTICNWRGIGELVLCCPGLIDQTMARSFLYTSLRN